MLIGLNYIIGYVFEIPNTAVDVFKAIKGNDVNHWFFTVSKYLIPVLAFIAFVLLASYLTKHGEKREMPEPENGYFLTPGKNLLLAAVTIPAICQVIQYAAYSLLATACVKSFILLLEIRMIIITPVKPPRQFFWVVSA